MSEGFKNFNPAERVFVSETSEGFTQSQSEFEEALSKVRSLKELSIFLSNIEEIEYKDYVGSEKKEVTKKVGSNYFQETLKNLKDRSMVERLPSVLGIRDKGLELYDKNERREEFFYLKKKVDSARNIDELVSIISQLDTIEFINLEDDVESKELEVYYGRNLLEAIGRAGVNNEDLKGEALFEKQIEDLDEGLIGIDRMDDSGCIDRIDIREKAQQLFKELHEQGKDDEIISAQLRLNEKLYKPEYKKGMNLSHYLADSRHLRDELITLLNKADTDGVDKITFNNLSIEAKGYLMLRVNFPNNTDFSLVNIVSKNGSEEDQELWRMMPRNLDRDQTLSVNDPDFVWKDDNEYKYSAMDFGKDLEEATVSDPDNLYERDRKDIYVSQLFNAMGVEKEEILEELEYLVNKAEDKDKFGNGKKKILFSELSEDTQIFLNNAMSPFFNNKDVPDDAVILDSGSQYWKDILNDLSDEGEEEGDEEDESLFDEERSEIEDEEDEDLTKKVRKLVPPLRNT